MRGHFGARELWGEGGQAKQATSSVSPSLSGKERERANVESMPWGRRAPLESNSSDRSAVDSLGARSSKYRQRRPILPLASDARIRCI